MRMASLSSGSSGNAIYIGSEKRNVLVDAGISLKKIDSGLSELGLAIQDLDGIFITHEHADHIGGLGTLLRKCFIPVYLTEGTYDYIMGKRILGNVPEEAFNIITAGSVINFGDMCICPHSVSHDAAEPVIYRFDSGDKSMAIVTDLGVTDDKLEEKLCGLDALFLEANHDRRMLQVGPYPYNLKRRILSDDGHLSNEDAGKLLTRLNCDKLKSVLLGHISATNNYESLALEAVRMELAMADQSVELLKTAPRAQLSDIIEV